MRDIISARMKEISGGFPLVREKDTTEVDDSLHSKSDVSLTIVYIHP